MTGQVIGDDDIAGRRVGQRKSRTSARNRGRLGGHRSPSGP
jgi:hypothetical protein